MTADRFAFRLKELRAQAGLTQRQLAERAGMTEAGVRNLEQGRTGPTWESVVLLAEAMGVPTDAFREAPVEPSPEKSKRGRPRKVAREPEAIQSMEILQTPFKDMKDRVQHEMEEEPSARAGPSGQDEPSEEKPVQKTRKRKGG